MLIGAAALALGLLASALTRNQIVAATLSFVSFFVLLLVGALEAQVGDPRLAAVAAALSLFRIMEDFGHGIVDSRQVVLLVTVVVLALAAAAARSRRCATDADRRAGDAALIAASGRRAGRGHRAHGQLPGRAALRARRLDAGAALRAVGQDVNVLQHLSRPVDGDIFMYPGRDSERARALGGMVRELAIDSRATRPGGSTPRSSTRPEPGRAEAAAKKYGIGATRWGRAS